MRHQSEHLCQPLEKEDYVVQPIVDVSPPKWHLGHTTWFFEQMILSEFANDYKAFHPEFNFIFNSYYETVGKRVLRTNRGNLTRPSTDQVYAYRKYVNEQFIEFLDQQESLSEQLAQLIELGLQHEQQHQELLTYDIKYILGGNPLFPIYYKSLTLSKTDKSRPMGFLKIPEGNYSIGYDGDQFSFDNEHGQHKVFLHAFDIADRLVTNEEYLAFIEEGGYQDFRHWYMEGFEWVKANQEKSPYHWHNVNGEWHQFTFGGLQKLDLSAPVTHISQFEAAAFASWKGMRLPTEFEWEVACQLHEPAPTTQSNFVESETMAPLAAGPGHYQFFGDCWEWTNSAYLPYPYYKKDEGAIGEYNGKFMINQMVLRGGSFATPKNHIRTTYRNFFHPHLKWHFTGIRLAKHA